MSESLQILDCTLRDGSYLIDYQFTAEDTYIISLGLERAGFKWIEIGHGTGLRSSEAGKGAAAASDIEYLQAARTALSGMNAKFGMFFIPGIGQMEDLELAAEYGMGFIRVGTNVTEIEQAQPYIERAKKLGFIVSSNLIKSYAVPIDVFIRSAKKADEYGADIISVVDSAGGMFPEDVRQYVCRLRDITDKQIGFHGHNNLQLAIANTLEAVKTGATIIDSSLQSMGRSAGNAQTEILVMVLEKLGYKTGIDPYKTLDLGERIIKPMMNKQQGIKDIDIISGIAQFHSSFSNIVFEAAGKHGIDPRMLIVEVSDVERVNVTAELADKIARRIKERTQGEKKLYGIGSDGVFLKKAKSGTPLEQLHCILDEIGSLSKKTGLDSVFSLTLSKADKTVFPFIRKGSSMIIGNCEASSLEELSAFMECLDGKVNWILLDESSKIIRQSNLSRLIQKSLLSWYSEERAIYMSTIALISQRRPQGSVLLLADQDLTTIISLILRRHGVNVVTQSQLVELKKVDEKLTETISGLDIIIAFDESYTEELNENFLANLRQDVSFYAAKPNAYQQDFFDSARRSGFSFYRIDTRAGLAAELNLVVGTRKLVESSGSSTIADIPVVSGGMIGPKGTVVVDTVKEPSMVIGVADGSGGLLSPEREIPYRKLIEKVKTHIAENRYQSSY
jgi:4-hydroxy-2-oxovalerate aldolase